MKRDRQIQLLAEARQRGEDRVREWHSDPKVRASFKADLELVRQMKLEKERKCKA